MLGIAKNSLLVVIIISSLGNSAVADDAKTYLWKDFYAGMSSAEALSAIKGLEIYGKKGELVKKKVNYKYSKWMPHEDAHPIENQIADIFQTKMFCSFDMRDYLIKINNQRGLVRALLCFDKQLPKSKKKVGQTDDALIFVYILKSPSSLTSAINEKYSTLYVNYFRSKKKGEHFFKSYNIGKTASGEEVNVKFDIPRTSINRAPVSQIGFLDNKLAFTHTYVGDKSSRQAVIYADKKDFERRYLVWANAREVEENRKSEALMNNNDI
jgi:hypothetical protein